MKKTKIFAMLFSLACAAGFYSCSDDDDVKPALQTPSVSETASTYNSLSFAWSEVANATKYGYRLTDSENIAVNAGVTYDRSVTISGLKPASTYTLEVWAFASMDGDYSTPPAVTLTATTEALVKLATPTGLTLDSSNGFNYTASWSAVPNAIVYCYTVRNSEGTLILSDTTEETSVEVRNLENGDYVFYVYAEAHDGFDTGDSASASFNVERPDITADTLAGTYDNHFVGTEWLTSSNFTETSWDTTWEAYATVSMISDDSVSVDGLFFTGYPVVGTLDLSTMTITFEITDGYYRYYRLASGSDPDTPAIGYVSDDGSSISIPNFGAWYNYGTESAPDWDYFLLGTSTLTKSN